MAFAETAPLIATLDLKGNFASQLKRNQSALSSFSGSLGRAGRGAGQLGAGFARVGTILGTAVAGGLVGVAKAAIDFEDAFAGVRKTVDEADLKAVGLSFDALAKQFRTMATEIPIAATEFARIGEAAGALGIKAQDIDDFTKTVALLGVTTDLTTDQAAESLGKIGTILGFTGKEFEEFADVLVNLGNKGSSVESEIIEIVKRFAASGKQAGLSVQEITAYSSAIASAGADAESAGSSLSRLFGNLITDTANATSKGKAFAKISGKSFADFSKIVKDDTNGAMLLFLDSLKDLDKFSQQQALEAVGITNIRDRNAILLLAGTLNENLVPALKNAQEATGSLSKEAQERFNTVASKLTLLKNNFIEAGITIGEGFLPALGRATDKLIAFLKVDANKSALKNIGEDIGKALDSINWDEVLSGVKQLATLLKGALGVAKTLYDSFMLLPGPVKEAAAGFLVLNKLSGGLIGSGAGNLIGGLTSAIARAGAAKLPVVGSLFVQPVFVTNWAMMAGGGIGIPGADKGGWIAKLGLAIAAAVPVVLLKESGIVDQIVAGINKGLWGEEKGAAVTAADDYITQGRGIGAFEPGGIFGPKLDANTAALNDNTAALTQLGPPTPVGPPAPNDPFLDALRSRASLDDIRARALAAGFNPTEAAVTATLERNLERQAAANLAAVNRVTSEAARTTAAALLTAAAVQNMDRKPPIVNVNWQSPDRDGPSPRKPLLPSKPSPRVARPGDSGFASGAWDIPRDMAAFIHKGEMIVPSRLAEKLRRSLTDEEQRQAEEELRARLERRLLLQASLATQRLRAARAAPTRSSEMFGGRFIPSAMLDASQIQDRRQLPTPNVAVTVNVTAAQVAKSIVIQKRFGPPNGSRGAMPGDSGV